MNKFHEIEIEKLFSLIETRQNQRLQVAIFFGTANLTAVSIALTSQQSGVLILSSLLLFGLTLVAGVLKGLMTLVILRLIYLHEKYADEPYKIEGIFLAFGRKKSWIAEIRQFPVKAWPQKVTFIPPLRHLGWMDFWCPLLLAISEILMGLTLWLKFGWSLF